MPPIAVIVVGAGPSGLLLSLLLSRSGIPVTLLEKSNSLDVNPRASHYMPESCMEFERAGTDVLDDIKKQGFFPNGVSWRKLDRPSPNDEDAENGNNKMNGWESGERNKRLVKLRNPDPPEGKEEEEEWRYRMVCLPLHRLGKVLLGKLEEGTVQGDGNGDRGGKGGGVNEAEGIKGKGKIEGKAKAEVKWGWEVIDVGEDDDQGFQGEVGDGGAGKHGRKAWVKATTPSGTTSTIKADYIIACDGANSTIRKLLFANSTDPFPGFTWDKQIVATNVYYPFDKYHYDDSQFFIDTEHWHMVAKIQPDGLYRVTYGEVAGLSNEELKERLEEKFRRILPGNPGPGEYQLVSFSPYKVHQRCVEKMRVGKGCLLVADAAHLCNPFGGLGLTGGIADVGSLYDCLVGIHTGKADDSILDKYDEVRRGIWNGVINPTSSDNMRRLFWYEDPDKALEKEPFFRMLGDMGLIRKEGNFAKEMEVGASGPKLPAAKGGVQLRHDMTRYYFKEVRRSGRGI